MIPTRHLRRFLVIALAAYLGLVFAWEPVSAPFRAGLAATADALFGWFGGDRRVDVTAETPGIRGGVDVLLHLRTSLHDGRLASHPFNSYFQAYLPLAVLWAAVLATPSPWRRRLRNLAVGSGAVLGFLALVLALEIAFGFCNLRRPDGRPMLDLGAAGGATLAWIHFNLYFERMVYFVFPLGTWALLSFAGRSLDGGAPALEEKAVPEEEAAPPGPTAARGRAARRERREHQRRVSRALKKRGATAAR